MESFWYVMIMLIFIFVVFLLPIAIFHYEAYEEVEIRSNKPKISNSGACCSALKMEFLVLLVTGLTLGLLYAFIGIAKVPVIEYNMDLTSETLWLETPPTQVDISTTAGV